MNILLTFTANSCPKIKQWTYNSFAYLTYPPSWSLQLLRMFTSRGHEVIFVGAWDAPAGESLKCLYFPFKETNSTIVLIVTVTGSLWSFFFFLMARDDGWNVNILSKHLHIVFYVFRHQTQTYIYRICQIQPNLYFPFNKSGFKIRLVYPLPA